MHEMACMHGVPDYINCRTQPQHTLETPAMKTATTTNMTTADGLTVYDLDPQASELWAVAGPANWDPSRINPDALPASFRWVEEDEWERLHSRAILPPSSRLAQVLRSTLAEHGDWSAADSEAIRDLLNEEGRNDLLECDIVVIPGMSNYETSVLWFDDGYNTMLSRDGGYDWLAFSEGSPAWEVHARKVVTEAGYECGFGELT